MTQSTFSAVPAQGTLWVDNSTVPPSLVISGTLTGGGVPTGTTGTPNAAVVTVQGITGGTPQAANITQVGTAAVSLGAKTSALSIPVVLASDEAALPVTLPALPATGTMTSVASANADTSLLASNAPRKGAAVTNDSTANLFLLVAAGTASATVYTAKLVAGAYYEVPFGYTGAIRGFWDAANGFARITEYTA